MPSTDAQTNPLKPTPDDPSAPRRRGRPNEVLGAFDLTDHVDHAIRLLGYKPDNQERNAWLRSEWARRNGKTSIDGESYFIAKISGKRPLAGSDIRLLHDVLGLHDIGLREQDVWLAFGADPASRCLRHDARGFAEVIEAAMGDHRDPLRLLAAQSDRRFHADYARLALQNLAMVDGHERLDDTAPVALDAPCRLLPGERYSLSLSPCVTGHILILHQRDGQAEVQIANEAFGLPRDRVLARNDLFESPVVIAPRAPGLRQVIFVNWPEGLDPDRFGLADLFALRVDSHDQSLLRRLAGAVLRTRDASDAGRIYVRLRPMDVLAEDDSAP